MSYQRRKTVGAFHRAELGSKTKRLTEHPTSHKGINKVLVCQACGGQFLRRTDNKTVCATCGSPNLEWRIRNG